MRIFKYISDSQLGVILSGIVIAVASSLGPFILGECWDIRIFAWVYTIVNIITALCFAFFEMPKENE